MFFENAQKIIYLVTAIVVFANSSATFTDVPSFNIFEQKNSVSLTGSYV